MVKSSDDYSVAKIAVALGTELRRSIVREIVNSPLTVKELAFKLNVSVSTISVNVKILEDADLIRTSYQAGKHGSIKLCSIKYERLIVDFMQAIKDEESVGKYTINMPVGAFYDFDIKPTCGMLDENGFIGKDDDRQTFYNPNRFAAQLLWFYSGYVEYRFQREMDADKTLSLQFSLECCSEAPGFRNEYPSDITFWINDKEICEWRSPGDFGGKRGAYSPEWWPTTSTQFGLLKRLNITKSGSFLDNLYVGKICLNDLKLNEKDYISFKIGVKDNAKNVGGINIFGDKFGNYPQSIQMTVECINDAKSNGSNNK